MRTVQIWLYGLCLMVFAMVLLGGATRLTDSGLSITEWRPLIGMIPPLSELDWQTVFLKYQQIPEYSRVNAGMSLADFKWIFWWEWSHRFLGRLIGLALVLPWIFFHIGGQNPQKSAAKIAGHAFAWWCAGIFRLVYGEKRAGGPGGCLAISVGRICCWRR